MAESCGTHPRLFPDPPESNHSMDGRGRHAESHRNHRLAKQMRMWGPAAVWAAVLFLLSAWPNPVGPSWLYVSDKVAHVALYGVLGAALGVGRWWSGASVSHVVVLAVGCLYGATDEWHQAWVPNRVPAFDDWVADVVGVVVGYSLVTYLARSAEPRAGAVSQAD